MLARYLKPKIRDTKPETRDPKSQTRNVTQNETRDSRPETPNLSPKPENYHSKRSPKQNPKPETLKPRCTETKPETRNETWNPNYRQAVELPSAPPRAVTFTASDCLVSPIWSDRALFGPKLTNAPKLTNVNFVTDQEGQLRKSSI